MKTIPVEYAAIPGHSRLFLEFLHSPDAVSYYPAAARLNCKNPAAYADRIAGRLFPRAEIARALVDFNSTLENSPLAVANARSLADSNVFGVITGQQPGLFGGPALSVYKALTAVSLSSRMQQEGISAVPLFWVASEDHDFEEIRQTTFLDGRGSLSDLSLPKSDGHPLTAAQRSVGDVRLLLARLQEALSGTGHGAAVVEWVRSSYRPDATLAEGFARLMTRILGRFGMVMLDASDLNLRRLSAPFYARAIADADVIARLLQERAGELKAGGFHAQVHWEADYTLLFHVSHTGRRAIRRRNGGFVAGEQTWSKSELIDEIGRDPGSFSPSALLRPLIQEAVVPTLVYVGGPAEVAYFAQVQALSTVFNCEPAIHPRMSFLLMDARARRYLNRSGLKIADLFCSQDELREKMAGLKLRHSVLAEWEQEVAAAEQKLGDLRALAERADPSLGSAMATSGRKIAHQLAKMRRKIVRVTAEKDQRAGVQAQYLHSLVYPGNMFQERRVNFLSFYARYGPAILDALVSFSPCDKHSNAVFPE